MVRFNGLKYTELPPEVREQMRYANKPIYVLYVKAENNKLRYLSLQNTAGYHKGNPNTKTPEAIENAKRAEAYRQTNNCIVKPRTNLKPGEDPTKTHFTRINLENVIAFYVGTKIFYFGKKNKIKERFGYDITEFDLKSVKSDMNQEFSYEDLVAKRPQQSKRRSWFNIFGENKHYVNQILCEEIKKLHYE